MSNILTTLELEDGTVLSYSSDHPNNITTAYEWQVERVGAWGPHEAFDPYGTREPGQADAVSDSGLVTMTVDGDEYATNFYGELVA